MKRIAMLGALLLIASSVSAQSRGPGQVRTDGGSPQISGEVIEQYVDSTGGMVFVRENLVTLAVSNRDQHAEAFVVLRDTPEFAGMPARKAGQVFYPEYGTWSALGNIGHLVAKIKDPAVRALVEKARLEASKHPNTNR